MAEGLSRRLSAAIETQAAGSGAKLGDPGVLEGTSRRRPVQANWYALGRRALMNADPYGQFTGPDAGGGRPA